MSEGIQVGKRDVRGEWQPEKLPQVPPVMVWPPRPLAFLKWFLGYPGYLWPWNAVYAIVATLTWLYLTPSLETMKTFQFGWIAYLLIRNLVFLVAIVSAWHLLLYVKRVQGTEYKYSDRWLSKGNPAFMFNSQVLDNIFWTLVSAVPVWTAFEVLTWWAQANGYIPYVDWGQHPIYCALILVLIPAFREFHFYLSHRLIHWPPLYRAVHHVHHRNVNIGPWSGLSMHPIEHVLYFSGILIHWIVPSNPVHIMFHMQHLAFVPAQGHSGFDQIVVGDDKVDNTHYMHYLHHKYFEVNYGGDGTIPLDQWFGTMHDGSEAAQEAMNRRFQARRRAKQTETAASN